MSTLENLPREIISLICSLLEQPEKYNCIYVNKELYSASIPELWREPTLPSTKALHQLIKCLHHSKHQRGDYIRVIRLGCFVGINDEELLSLLPLIPNLEVLELRQAEQLTDKSLIPVSRYCKQLKQFGVKRALATYRTMHYLGGCVELQRLTLAACPNLTPMALLPFAHLPIEHLDLSGCKWLTASDTARDLCSLEHLTSLSLICCDVISADFLHQLTGALIHLQDFSITGNAVIEDDAVIPFLKTHPNLHGLFLLECAITDATLKAIGQYLPNLHHLDISFCTRVTTHGVRDLVFQCPHLKLLGVKYCGIVAHDFPELQIDEIELDTLNYIKLDQIRNHHQEEESIRESYAYIHQFLSTEQVH